jgi:hypothetical protein
VPQLNASLTCEFTVTRALPLLLEVYATLFQAQGAGDWRMHRWAASTHGALGDTARAAHHHTQAALLALSQPPGAEGASEGALDATRAARALRPFDCPIAMLHARALLARANRMAVQGAGAYVEEARRTLRSLVSPGACAAGHEGHAAAARELLLSLQE